MIKVKGRRGKKRSIGTAELAMLRWIADNPNSSLTDIYEGFGKPQGYVKGTLIQMLARLEKKKYVKRSKKGSSVYLYSSAQDFSKVKNEEIDRLVDAAFEGSLGALALHLQERVKGASAKDKKQIQELLKTIKSGK